MAQVYSGARQIVLGIDIGTTQSAVAYAYLYPGGPQTPQRVTRWPGQESQKNETKIPSIVWYDRNGKAKAFGAEARLSEIEEEADEEQWELVKHFKLHLHPESMRAEHDIRVEPLPDGVSVEQVYADLLGYIFRHTASFFKETTIDGPALWTELRDSMVFVVAHPNGWDMREQTVLQKAAIKAGLVSSTKEAEERIKFVSEAEASVHFVMFNADLQNNFKVNTEFVVCDAGGSTVDTTLYSVSKVEPLLELKEKRASACVQAGAIFVDEFAKAHFRKIFTEAGLKSDEIHEYIGEALTNFESDTKKSFENAVEDKSIKVGPHRFTNSTIGVRKGRMAVSGKTIESFFSPCVSQVITSIQQQIEGQKPKYLLIVGGFGDSPYLRKRLQAELGGGNLQVILANDSTAKAVSDGAIMWFIKQNVVARATRFDFGIEFKRVGTAEQSKRLGRTLVSENDGDWIHGYWGPIVTKGVVMATEEEKLLSTRQLFYGSGRPYLSNFSSYLYASEHTSPEWLFDPNGNTLPGFRQVCTVTADLSPLQSGLTMLHGVRGPYWEVRFSIALQFGMTSLKAFLVWTENGVQKRGPATLIPAAFC